MTGEEYLEESDHFETAGSKNPLEEGVVGRHIVAHFKNLDGRVAVDAKTLGSQAEAQQDYLITFEDGQTQAYRVTFTGGFRDPNPFDIVDSTPLN